MYLLSILFRSIINNGGIIIKQLDNLLVIVLLSFLSIVCKAQNDTTDRGLILYGTDGNIVFDDSLQDAFEKINDKLFAKCDAEVASLPIDRCKNAVILIRMRLDENGKVKTVEFLTALDNAKIKNAIRNIVFNASGEWKLPLVLQPGQLFEEHYKFIQLNNYAKSYRKRTENDELYRSGQYVEPVRAIRIEQGKKWNPMKNCEDASYYFDEGVKSFQKNNLKSALNLFEKSVALNPYNVDVLFNLAVVNRKLGNLEEACNYVNKAAKLDNSITEALIKQMCQSDSTLQK